MCLADWAKKPKSMNGWKPTLEHDKEKEKEEEESSEKNSSKSDSMEAIVQAAEAKHKQGSHKDSFEPA